MGLVSPPRSVHARRLLLAGLVALLLLGMLGGVLAVRATGSDAPRGAPPWTIVVEHAAEVREAAPWLGVDQTLVTRSTARIWFVPTVGWRMEVETTGDHGPRQRVFGSDGVTVWASDPATNRYTRAPADPARLDPRRSLAVMMATAGTSDADAALAALRRLPDVTVTVEGTELVAGRSTTVVVLSPHSCSESIQQSVGGAAVQERHCGGFTRAWLDAVTGWVLQAEADDGRGGGFRWETVSVAVGRPIDPAHWQFVPPPGSVQVETLD